MPSSHDRQANAYPSLETIQLKGFSLFLHVIYISQAFAFCNINLFSKVLIAKTKTEYTLTLKELWMFSIFQKYVIFLLVL